MSQLTLDLPRRTAFGRSDFMVSDGNAAAVDQIDRWPDWPSGALALFGPAGCGKTHLAHLWRERASALILPGETLTEASWPELLAQAPHRIAVDDADRATERVLLHLYNFCLERQGSVLITARRPPGSWQVVFGDLRSRLRAIPAISIDAPDDALLGAVLVKHFADRQLSIAPAVIIYLIRRIERSLATAEKIAARLDAAALSNGGPVTIPLARKVLADLHDQPLSPGNDAMVT
jgi:chromosomal replication initiation ATPase DnaA